MEIQQEAKNSSPNKNIASYRMLHRASDFDIFCIWENNMKMGLRNMIQGVNRIYLTQDR
jgi:hypothetical protein